MCRYWSSLYNLPALKDTCTSVMCRSWSNLYNLHTPKDTRTPVMCRFWSNLYNLYAPKDALLMTCQCWSNLYNFPVLKTHSQWCASTDQIYNLHAVRTRSPWCMCSDHIYYLHAIRTRSQWCAVSDQIYNLRALKRHCLNFEGVAILHESLCVWQFLHASLCDAILRCSRSMTAFPAMSFSCTRRCSVSLRVRVCRWCSSHRGDRTKRADSSCISTTNGSSIPPVDWSPKATPLAQLVSVCLSGRNWWAS